MSTPAVPGHTETGRVKRSGAAAIVYAVGAGHVALDRTGRSGGRGRGLALAALGTGYALATLSLFSILSYLQAVIRQLAG